MKRVYGVRIHKPYVVPSAKEGGQPTFRLRWKLPGRDKPFSKNFDSDTELDSFRSELVTAKNRGEAFDLETGLPVSMLEPESEERESEVDALPPLTFFALARDYAAMKWPDLSAKSRETVAQTLSALTVALVDPVPGQPADIVLGRSYPPTRSCLHYGPTTNGHDEWPAHPTLGTSFLGARGPH